MEHLVFMLLVIVLFLAVAVLLLLIDAGRLRQKADVYFVATNILITEFAKQGVSVDGKKLADAALHIVREQNR